MVNERIELAKLAYIILLTYPGSPSIYYGSEIGMTGENIEIGTNDLG